MMTTVGMYTEAGQKFDHDEEGLPEGSPQYLQLERIKAETRFFALAKPDLNAKYWDKEKKVDTRQPDERFKLVDSLLDELEDLAADVAASDDHEAKVHTQLEVARTRADVFAWIAYDKDRLDQPLKKATIKEARKLVEDFVPFEKPSNFLESPSRKKAVDKPDVLRYWALKEAQRICEEEIRDEKFGEPSMEVDFALAECYFKLRDKRAIGRFEKLERDVSSYFGEDREKRHEVALEQSLLICQCRLLTLRRDALAKEKKRQSKRRKPSADVPPDRTQEEERHIRGTQRDTNEKLNQIPRGRVTIFSHIQRRNLTREEFAAEVEEIVYQEKMKDSAAATK
jgi:hypothetical protein